MTKAFAQILFGCCLLWEFFPFLAHAQFKTPENVPITFYGKVVDQRGEPIAGATVTFDLVTSHIRRLETTAKPMILKTGADGRFTLSGVKGYAIDQISIPIEGYKLSKNAPHSFTFGLLPDYTPDQGNPVIFKMWKMKGPESLIQNGWHGRLTSDGRTNRFDLLTGHSDPNGNLEIICKRIEPSTSAAANHHFGYTCRIEVLGGGIQPTSDEFTYLAPESGYSPSFNVEHAAEGPNWEPAVRHEFYIRTAEGHFGRLYFEWYAWQAPLGHVKWNSSINPSGSRNLER